MTFHATRVAIGFALAGSLCLEVGAQTLPVRPVTEVIDQYCVTCHSDRGVRSGRVPISLQTIDASNVGADAEAWEKVVRKLRAGMMPPAGQPRPDMATSETVVTWIEGELDRAAATNPKPGRTTVHRLNRIEYSNAVRDLIGLDVDPEALLPPDDEDEGFENIADVLSVSPTLMERYLSAARRVSQLAVGDARLRPRYDTYRVPDREIQDARTTDDLPFGTRGGIALRHYFPLDGEYLIKVGLRRNFYNYIRGIGNVPHQLDVRVDGVRVATFMAGGGLGDAAARCVASFCGSSGMGGPEWEWYANHADDDFEVRVQVKTGMRRVGIAFVRKPALEEGVLQPPVDMSTFGYSTDEEMDGQPAVGNVVIGGPFDGVTPEVSLSRQKIFVCRPAGRAEEERCAKQIIGTLARRAYRRPVTASDVDDLFTFFETGSDALGFDAGIQAVMERILVDPEFLFRVPRPPAEPTEPVYRIGDVELASRLSFFLWSSIPDDELLGLAEQGTLTEPAVLERQVRRMLADPRADALVDNFFDRWLELHKIRNVAPDPTIFAAFDENLRDAMQRETELFLSSQLREDRSVVDLLRANYTFINERLAQHYGMPEIYGNHFRRVTLSDNQRAGLIGKASILTLTSYSNRTSVVTRGKWVLELLWAGCVQRPGGDRDDGYATSNEDQKRSSHRVHLLSHKWVNVIVPDGQGVVNGRIVAVAWPRAFEKCAWRFAADRRWWCRCCC